MGRVLNVAVAGVLALAAAGCGNEHGVVPAGPDVEAQGSTAYFFEVLDMADAAADYISQPVSLTELLPNRTVRVLPPASAAAEARAYSFSWSDRVVVGRVTGVRLAERNRALRLTVEVAETFPAAAAPAGPTLTIDLPSYPGYANKYQVSATALDRVVLGISDELGEPQVARAAQMFGVLDDEDRITWPLLRPDDFTDADWDRGTTTLAGLRAEATAPPSTVTVER